MQNLFQIAGYTMETAGGTVESMPFLPCQQPDGTAAYQGVFPLYRLCGDEEFPYSAVGQTVSLRFFRRDVLGNTAERGLVDMTGEYKGWHVLVKNMKKGLSLRNGNIAQRQLFAV